MSTVKFMFYVSDAYVKARFVETGEMIQSQQSVMLDMAEATPEQRQIIVNQIGTATALELKRWDVGSDKPYLTRAVFEGIPTLNDMVAHCQRMEAERIQIWSVYDARKLEHIRNDIDAATLRLRDCIERHVIDDRGVSLNTYEADDRKRLAVDLTEYNTLRAEYDVMADERRAEMEAEHAENERKREAAKAAKEAEKTAWVQAHGSEHLQRACAAGHDCSRMYWRERAASEYPGYVVDIENEAGWKSRSCPSIEALDERDAVLAVHPGVEIEIVWLTAEPSDHKRRHDEQDEFEACEAVVVKSTGLPESLYPYDLVKVM
jgi:hypothetical protein